MLRRAIGWAYRCLPKAASIVVKIGSFVFGVLILKHQALDNVASPQPLLIFLGLWLCGVPPATFFDSIRKVGQQVDDSLSNMTSHIPKPEDIVATEAAEPSAKKHKEPPNVGP